ncbi:MAG: hypothetical protein FJ316_09955 [SAR202 cluster bacterium]|nr:hypothetical protein [SAR202 cluster bacterium]
MSSPALTRATLALTEKDLEFMALLANELPGDLRSYKVAREGPLDNARMAQHSFGGRTATSYAQAGRINGYLREFGPVLTANPEDGMDIVAASVAHLFHTPDSVSGWMRDVFLKDFEEHVGQSMGRGNQLISVKRLQPAGFFDEAVGLKVLQGGSKGLASSTVIDFRVGRILGVVYVGSVGDHDRLDLATQLGLAMEKRIVRVALGAA